MISVKDTITRSDIGVKKQSGIISEEIKKPNQYTPVNIKRINLCLCKKSQLSVSSSRSSSATSSSISPNSVLIPSSDSVSISGLYRNIPDSVNNTDTNDDNSIKHSCTDKNVSNPRRQLFNKFQLDKPSWFTLNSVRRKRHSDKMIKTRSEFPIVEQTSCTQTILNLLDSVGPHQLCSLLNEVIHELFSTSHFISIQRLDSSVKSLIKDFLNQTDMIHLKSNNKSTQNKTSDFFIFSTDHESGSSKNSVKSFVVKLDHVKNVELRDLLLLERQTIGVPKFVVICLVGENETWENGILISFCLTKFLTSDRKLLEMFTVKLHTLTVTTTSMTLRKGLAQPIMKCQFDTKNDTSNPIQEQTCFDLVKLSHDLLQQMTQRTDYSHGVLMFSTDDSDKLLCIASSNDLFVGEQTVQIQKSIFETHLTSCENSAIYEIEEDTNSHLMINTSNNLNINFYLVAYLWSICTNESSNSVNDCLMNSRNEYSQVNNLLTLYRQELSEACRLRYLFDWNILNQKLIMLYFSP
ncbi:unnamed protein product [Heterobilharzia americana]|nr:unnamed protein product [Heterobilharzia americana]